MEKFNLDVFSSKLAIGTIWLVAIFLFICGFYNIFPFIEELSSSHTWGIVVAIPTLVFSYTLGALAMFFSNTSFSNPKNPNGEIESFIIVAESGNEIFIKRYESLKNEYEFFKACIPTIIFLGISVMWGSYGVYRNGSELEVMYIAILLGFLTILSSLIIVKITRKQYNTLTYFIENIKNLSNNGPH